MAGRRAHAQALILVVLFVMSSWLNAVAPSTEETSVLEAENEVMQAGQGDEIDLTLTTNPNTMFKLDLPSGEPLVNAELKFTPKVLPTQSGFVWDSESDWNHADAISNGSTVSSGVLTGSSRAFFGISTPTIRVGPFQIPTLQESPPPAGTTAPPGVRFGTYAGSTYGTSPVVNLAGGANIPFHAWVHEGRSGAVKRRTAVKTSSSNTTAAGGWTVFQTFSGGGSQTTNFQFMTTAGGRDSRQLAIPHPSTSGSSTCWHYWFVDDIHIATPPGVQLTSPTMGHKVGSTQTLAADTYAPLYIEANIPNGAFLNWSVLNSAGEVLPGMQGTNELVVPLNLLDHDLVDQFRLHLEFKGSESGIPEVHSITGDGAYRETFVTDPTTRGWTLSDAAYVHWNWRRWLPSELDFDLSVDVGARTAV